MKIMVVFGEEVIGDKSGAKGNGVCKNNTWVRQKYEEKVVGKGERNKTIVLSVLLFEISVGDFYIGNRGFIGCHRLRFRRFNFRVNISCPSYYEGEKSHGGGKYWIRVIGKILFVWST